MFAMRRVGEQQIALNQQLLPGPVAVRIDANAEEDWRMVTPADIQGQYDFRVEDANESLMRQERRAEALAFANWFGQNYMLLTQSGVTPNMRRVAEDVIQAFDEDPKEYLGEEAAMQAQPNPLVGGMGAAPPGPTTPNGATGVAQAGPVDFSNLATILGAGPGEPSL
jgi:hypothetical protein